MTVVCVDSCPHDSCRHPQPYFLPECVVLTCKCVPRIIKGDNMLSKIMGKVIFQAECSSGKNFAKHTLARVLGVLGVVGELGELGVLRVLGVLSGLEGIKVLRVLCYDF